MDKFNKAEFGTAIPTQEENKERLIDRITTSLGKFDSDLLKKIIIILGTLNTATAPAVSAEAAWKEFTQSIKAGQEQKKEKKRILSTEEAQNKIEAVTNKEDPDYYNKKEELIDVYNNFPDDNELRIKAWEKIHPELSAFSENLSKIPDYGKAYLFLVKDIQWIIRGKEKENIKDLLDENGAVDQKKLKKKIDSIVEQIDFVETLAQKSALQTLTREGIINLFDKPEEIKEKGWNNFINSVSSQYQARLLREVIFLSDMRGKKINTPEELQKWVNITHWINTDEKRRLAYAIQAGKSMARLIEWKDIIEKICKPVIIVPKSKSKDEIKIGVNEEIIEEMERFLVNNREKVTPEEAEKKWQKLTGIK